MTASTRLMFVRCSRQGFVKGIQLRGLRRLFTTDWAAAQHVLDISALHINSTLELLASGAVTQLSILLWVPHSCCPHICSAHYIRPRELPCCPNILQALHPVQASQKQSSIAACEGMIEDIGE